jgi:hypothetical protein
MRRDRSKLQRAQRQYRLQRARTLLTRLARSERATLTMIHAAEIEFVSLGNSPDTKAAPAHPLILTLRVKPLQVAACFWLLRRSWDRLWRLGELGQIIAERRGRDWLDVARRLTIGQRPSVDVPLQRRRTLSELVLWQCTKPRGHLLLVWVATVMVLSQGRELPAFGWRPGLAEILMPHDRSVDAPAGEAGSWVGPAIGSDHFDTAGRPGTGSWSGRLTVGTVSWPSFSTSFLPVVEAAGIPLANSFATAGGLALARQWPDVANVLQDGPDLKAPLSSELTAERSAGAKSEAWAECIEHSADYDRLAAAQVAVLLRTGWKFISRGDIATARTAFRRAADACDTDAILALGETYDPAVLKTFGVAAGAADIATAELWYKKAISLGSAEASEQLAVLGRRF